MYLLLILLTFDDFIMKYTNYMDVCFHDWDLYLEIKRGTIRQEYLDSGKYSIGSM